MISRVIDRQAIVDKETTNGRITIASKSFERRLIDADCLITLVQESRDSVARDAWETEGSIKTADNEWTAVYLYSGDKKCSSSTYWNTGNPRHLVERCAFPVDVMRAVDAGGIHRLLEERFERSFYTDKGQQSSNWYRAGWEEIRAVVESSIRDKTAFAPKRKQPAFKHCSGSDMIYLMSETGTGWVKIGKCGASTTSPPAKRRSQYQPGNRREIIPVAAWRTNGKNPEAAMKAELKRYCKTHSKNFRSEWFELGVDRAHNLLDRVVVIHDRVTDIELGRH
jgi:hypothetical protein